MEWTDHVWLQVSFKSHEVNWLLLENNNLVFLVERACILVAICWLYATTWNIGPFVGWGRFIPEGTLDSCSFDYLTRDQAVRQCQFQSQWILQTLNFYCRQSLTWLPFLPRTIAYLYLSLYFLTTTSSKPLSITKRPSVNRPRRWTLHHFVRMLIKMLRAPRFESPKLRCWTFLCGWLCGHPTPPLHCREFGEIKTQSLH